MDHRTRFLSQAQVAIIEQAGALLDGLGPALRFVLLLVGDEPVTCTPPEGQTKASFLCGMANVKEYEIPIVLHAYLTKAEQDAKMERDS